MHEGITVLLSDSNIADILRISKFTVNRWIQNKTYKTQTVNGKIYFDSKDFSHIKEIQEINKSAWDEELDVTPLRPYKSLELFAGAGGLALGLEMAGFSHIFLNEIDHDSCQTLIRNRWKWNIVEGDIHSIDFTRFRDSVDLLSGGFPCQAFSYAGNGEGFNDIRGTLFFELARAVKEINPKIVLCENVRGLLTHDNGKTFSVIKKTIHNLGYTLTEPRVLQAILYKVPQKRERLILVAIRNDLAEKHTFTYPSPYYKIMTVRDALYKGELFETDVPESQGIKYNKNKQKIMELVPMGG